MKWPSLVLWMLAPWGVSTMRSEFAIIINMGILVMALAVLELV